MKSSRLLVLCAALLAAGCSAHRAKPISGDLEIIQKKGAKPSPLSPREEIRVALRSAVDAAEISSESDISVQDMNTKSLERWPAGAHKVTAKNIKNRKLRLAIPTQDGFFQVGTNKYRGTLILIPSDGKISVVNELGIDDYLKGVLPREAIVTWPGEALKAQAVASRTYLAAHLGKHSADGADLCSEVHCQVYGGMTKEHPKTNAAVDETRGEILTYQGKPIGAYFFAFCGGSTEKINAVWGNVNVPYLPQKKCQYCAIHPRYTWSLTIHGSEIFKALKKNNLVQGTELRSISIKKKSGSARAEIVTVRTNEGSFDMKGNAFRLALHPEKIRSTLWTHMKKRPDDVYEFEGRGWGHGVGMCQWGAFGQSQKGRGYNEILSFYYPGAKLVHWSR